MNDIYIYIEDFLIYKESLGFSRNSYKYFLCDYAKTIETEANFFLKQHVDNWCFMRNTESENGFRRRISAIREFSKYLYALNLINFIVTTDSLPHATVYTPYIFSDKELNKIFAQSDLTEHNSRCPGNHLVIPTIYRLIYFCGLRPNEGRELLREDVDFTEGTLLIRKNKTHKERQIPMAADVTDMCKNYQDKMDMIYPNSRYFFPKSLENPYSSKWLTIHFKQLWNQSKAPNNTNRIRVYDLRHRYATTVFMKWFDEGADLYAMLPYLSSYMGHAHLEETAYYIHLLPEKLKKTSVLEWNSFGRSLPEVENE